MNHSADGNNVIASNSFVTRQEFKKHLEDICRVVTYPVLVFTLPLLTCMCLQYCRVCKK